MNSIILRALVILMLAVTSGVSIAQDDRSEWDDDLNHSLPSCYDEDVEGLTDAYQTWRWIMLEIAQEYVTLMNEREGEINSLMIRTYLAYRYSPEGGPHRNSAMLRGVPTLLDGPATHGRLRAGIRPGARRLWT